MTSMPIFIPPKPFDLTECITCSNLVDISYDMYADWVRAHKPPQHDFHWNPPRSEFTFSPIIWGETKEFWIFKQAEPFALIASNKTQVFVIFRGTESTEDWLADGDADQTTYDLVKNYGNVHHGFFKLYKSIRKSLLQSLKKTIINTDIKQLFITGHSLGSGLSTLAVPDILNQSFIIDNTALTIDHFNLASPRVGDPEFTSALNLGRASNYRVVNTSDIVPTLPPSILGRDIYQHIGTAVTFTAQYGTYAGNHSALNSYHYALNNTQQPAAE